MSDLDEKITRALRNEEADLSRTLGEEPGIFELLLETFRGKRRWLNLLGAIWTLVFLVLGVISAVKFFRADATREMLAWALACVLCMLTVAMLKIWYWMELQRIVMMREIKRVELQISRLAQRLGA